MFGPVFKSGWEGGCVYDVVARCNVRTGSGSRVVSRLKKQFGRCHLFDGLARGRITMGTNIDVFAVDRFRGNRTGGVNFNAVLSLLEDVKFLRRTRGLLPPLPVLPDRIGGVGRGGREMERREWYYTNGPSSRFCHGRRLAILNGQGGVAGRSLVRFTRERSVEGTSGVVRRIRSIIVGFGSCTRGIRVSRR